MLKDEILNKISEIKEFSNKYYTLELIFKKIKSNSIEYVISELKSRINNRDYTLALNWEGTRKMYFKVKNDKMFLTTGNSNLSFYSDDVYEVKFNSKYEEAKFLFDIAGGLSTYDKLQLEENNWVKDILNSSRDILSDLIEEE